MQRLMCPDVVVWSPRLQHLALSACASNTRTVTRCTESTEDVLRTKFFVEEGIDPATGSQSVSFPPPCDVITSRRAYPRRKHGGKTL
jgi:hypothetical protein